jgi:hypothetical protein
MMQVTPVGAERIPTVRHTPQHQAYRIHDQYARNPGRAHRSHVSLRALAEVNGDNRQRQTEKQGTRVAEESQRRQVGTMTKIEYQKSRQRADQQRERVSYFAGARVALSTKKGGLVSPDGMDGRQRIARDCGIRNKPRAVLPRQPWP